ncbi:two-pore potassium channel 3-like [Silene latifolia]|uniref:two-pore potassium channel 3-like n=1 Tax=Silene latifolia TaxID=37657 RepID=UPI003D77499E
MEKEPLLPLLRNQHLQVTPPPPLTLSALPENEEISVSLTPSAAAYKDRLIFGPVEHHPSSSSNLLDALSLSASSPKPLSPFHNAQSCGYSVQNCNFSVYDDGNSVPFIVEQPQSEHQQQWLVDPNYKWRKTNLHRSRTAPAMAVINDVTFKKGLDKPEPTSKAIIRQAFLLLLVYLSFGILIYWFNRHNFTVRETHPVVDALYFCIVTMCTIGYGDITPNSTVTKVFSILFVLVGFGFIDILLSGMVSYVLDLQENHLLRTVKAGKQAKSVIIDVKKGRMRIRMKVGLALGVVVLCIGVGVGVLHFVENLGWVDAFYLSVMSVTTVGYGDRAFASMNGRIFASIWLLVSTLAVARAFLYLAEARVDKRNRRLAKWVLGQDLTVSQFLAADIDNNGFVSKSEYVIYKLKEMGKVSDKDILLICQKFDQLDTGNCGKITLADLMHGHL